MIDWDAFARRIQQYERLNARLTALEAAFRKRAERARDDQDITTMVRMRDAVHDANQKKEELSALADALAAALTRAQAQQSDASFDALMARLDETAAKSREIAALYEPYVDWDAMPS